VMASRAARASWIKQIALPFAIHADLNRDHLSVHTARRARLEFSWACLVDIGPRRPVTILPHWIGPQCNRRCEEVPVFLDMRVSISIQYRSHAVRNLLRGVTLGRGQPRHDGRCCS
jgi:hypothetical protein